MVAPLGAIAVSILGRAALAGGETLGAELLGAARGFMLPMAESGILEGIGEEFPPQTEITIPVSSEAIRAIGYSVGGIITVEFNRGGTYHYPGTEEMFLSFMLAPSKGRWFNEHLR